MSDPIALFESVIGKNPEAFLTQPVYQVTEDEVKEFAQLVVNQQAAENSDLRLQCGGMQMEIDELRGELHHEQCRASAFEAGNRVMEAQLKQLRAEHADLVDRNALLRQRPDLPVDRIPAHDKLVELQAEIARLKQVTNFKDAVACVFDCLRSAGRLTQHPEFGKYLQEVSLEVIEFAPQYKKDWKDLHQVGQALTDAEEELDKLKVDKARLDFWQSQPAYIGGFAPAKPQRWSFFLPPERTNGTGKACYGDTLREALDQLQVMHADLTKPANKAKHH